MELGRAAVMSLRASSKGNVSKEREPPPREDPLSRPCSRLSGGLAFLMRVSTSMVGSRNGFGSWEGWRNHNGLKPFGPCLTSGLPLLPLLSPACLPSPIWFGLVFLLAGHSVVRTVGGSEAAGTFPSRTGKSNWPQWWNSPNFWLSRQKMRWARAFCHCTRRTRARPSEAPRSGAQL